MTRNRVLTIAAVVVALGVFTALPNTASAQWGNYGNGYGNYNSWNYGWGGQAPRRWHDTSHWDYHPTTVVPHGNHYHVMPGHYDFHQTGHMHGRQHQHGGHHHH